MNWYGTPKSNSMKIKSVWCNYKQGIREKEINFMIKSTLNIKIKLSFKRMCVRGDNLTEIKKKKKRKTAHKWMTNF